MKSYTWKLAIAFALSYALLVMVVVFAYTHISSSFILRQAKDNMAQKGGVMAERINTQLSFDYVKIADLIESARLTEPDPISYLHNQASSITILNGVYEGFGALSNNSLLIDGETYTYTEGFGFLEIHQPVSIYSFNEAFHSGTDEKYIFFLYDDVVAYFSAELYLETLLSESEGYTDFAIITQDNMVSYASFGDVSLKYLYDYLRAENVSESLINQIKEVINNKTSGVFQMSLASQRSMVILNPLDQIHSSKQFYLLQVFLEENVLSSMTYLTNILWALFFVIFILFAGTLILLYKILETKMHDIENARMTHYYAKPYLVKINRLGKIKSYNQSFKKLLGDYDIYDNIKDFEIKKEFDLEAIEDIIHRQRAFTAIFELGLQRLVYIRFIPIKTAGGYLLVGDDITNIEGRFDEYRNMALYNKVTHLPNLNSFKQDVQAFFMNPDELKNCNSLLALDVVSFSKINVLLGERSGDRFLVIISELIDESLEGYPATLYNTTADSFIIFFRNIESYAWVSRWITKVLSIFEKPITIDKNFINIEVKIGVFNIENERYEILNADVAYDNMMLALNHAKESSQHKSFFYDVSLSLIASREQRMEADLANAIKNQEFYMVLQPQFNNQDEKIIGFEALIRWNNPKYASESPLKFIQMAERNNMIIDIGRIALHETFQIAKELEPYNIHVSLNISPVQILQAGFVNEIISVFEQYELKKHSISLEITETFLIGSFDLVINKLKLLQKYGFDIHLDDFGTGYSSLQYLKDLPINTIKIDRAFVINIETDAHSRAIVNMIASLAKNIGLNVVTEGIENDKQNQLVYRAGCNIIQGYLISPPVVKSEAIRLIREFNIDHTRSIDLQKAKKEMKR
jgi:EAL domain-containing protein (putative c-di-GMP-specific phosphodiesterase class I)/GGDEF domain-containing protein